MEIEDLADKDLENFIQNYRAKGVVEGGIFSLAELMLERLRRGSGSISGREITIRILELAQKTPDGLITYGELWKSLYPEKNWLGHASMKAIGADLGSSVHYCVLHGLPVVSVLVTRQGTRRLTVQDEQIAAMLSRLFPDPETQEEKDELKELFRAVSINNPDVLREMEPSFVQKKTDAEVWPPKPRLECEGATRESRRSPVWSQTNDGYTLRRDRKYWTKRGWSRSQMVHKLPGYDGRAPARAKRAPWAASDIETG